MNASRSIRIFFLLCCGVLVVSNPVPVFAQSSTDTSKADSQQPAALPDGQHDFDFELGSWKIHLKRRLNPLTGSNTWVEFDGTSVTRKVWDGRAQIEEFETDSPTSGHIEGLTLRTYNPKTHEWYLTRANS